MYNKVYEDGILREEQLSLHPQADNADIVQDKLYLQHAFTTDLKPFSVQYKFMNFLKNGFVYNVCQQRGLSCRIAADLK